MRREHDVVVAGGGLVGAVAAAGLAAAGLSVLLVDRGRPRAVRARLGGDIRTIACSPGSRRLLESVGIWAHLEPAPYRRMEVWEEQGTAVMTFCAEDVERRELGWILENGPTVEAAWQRFEQQPGAEVLLGELTGIEAGPDRVSVEIGGSRHDARLLLGVDGARSAVRSLVDAEVTTAPTGQAALATLARTERSHEQVAYQRFLLKGPLAFLPTGDPAVSSVVWSQPPEQAEMRSSMPEEAFCAEIESALESRLGRVLEVDQRVTFPLQQQVVRDFNPLARVLLIGDAARVLHPLAGLGANLGFEDVRDLLSRVQALPGGADPGASGIWRRYARVRRARAWMLVGAMSSFRRAYGEADPLRQWARNAAVGWLNQTDGVKRQLIREAMGFGPMASGW